MGKFSIFVLLLLFAYPGNAQLTHFVVQFKNKAATTHKLSSPADYLSQRAIERRARYNIAIDSTDLPVPFNYVSQVAAIPNVTVLNVSRWLNAISIQTSDANAIAAINALPFVLNTAAVAARPSSRLKNKIESEHSSPATTSSRPGSIESNFYNYGDNSLKEITLHKGEFLHNIGLRGQGIQIAMLDAGYFNYTTYKAFDSVNTNNQVLSTWDFVSREETVVEDHSHGMMCFSVIAANVPGTMVGKAPGAGFHLFRTEDIGSEYPIEEFNWACGAERADSIGADVISSSLGYGYDFSGNVPDYPFSDLNGDITMSARAADLAAVKGLLVVNSAGNSGTDYWEKITTPADGDSVLAVGAVDVFGTVGAFSSYGPSADGRIKPDVASVGVNALIQAPTNQFGYLNGTSLACPAIAGLASCLWQGFPEVNNMRIIRALREAGSTYQNPNNRIGYGIPDMKKALITLLKEQATSSVTISNCSVQLNWTSKDSEGMKYEIERLAPGDTRYTLIGQLPAMTGNTFKTHNYQVSDPLNGIPPGIITYRIRQVLDSSRASFTDAYIDTIEVRPGTTCTSDITAVYVAPNPVAGSSLLIVDSPEAVPRLSILIYDSAGKLMFRQRKTKPAGRAIFDLPSQKLSNGQYFIRVMNENKVLGKTQFLKL